MGCLESKEKKPTGGRTVELDAIELDVNPVRPLPAPPANQNKGKNDKTFFYNRT